MRVPESPSEHQGQRESPSSGQQFDRRRFLATLAGSVLGGQFVRAEPPKDDMKNPMDKGGETKNVRGTEIIKNFINKNKRALRERGYDVDYNSTPHQDCLCIWPMGSQESITFVVYAGDAKKSLARVLRNSEVLEDSPGGKEFSEDVVNAFLIEMERKNDWKTLAKRWVDRKNEILSVLEKEVKVVPGLSHRFEGSGGSMFNARHLSLTLGRKSVTIEDIFSAEEPPKDRIEKALKELMNP